MSDTEDHASDSDENDEDFCPENEQASDVSVEESDSNVSENEQESEDKDDMDQKSKVKKSRKRRKISKQTKKKETTDENESNENNEKVSPVNEEVKKKKVDALWADFLNDVGGVPKKSNDNSRIASSSSENSRDEKLPSETESEVKPQKIKVTEILEFAGEEVKIEKEISADELRRQLPKSSSSNSKKEPSKFIPALKRPATGGLSSILGQVGKKTKISVLEKSKLDWNSFKQNEGLAEELQTFNKGKDGYLERQDFLQRTDLRQFEIESALRKPGRSSKR